MRAKPVPAGRSLGRSAARYWGEWLCLKTKRSAKPVRSRTWCASWGIRDAFGFGAALRPARASLSATQMTADDAAFRNGIRSEPRIVVALTDHWMCAILCAELRERGYVASCVQGIAIALLLRSAQDEGPVEVALTDAESLRERDLAAIRWSRVVGGRPAALALVAADAAAPRGRWARVLRRPVTIGAVADAVESVVRTLGSTHTGAPPEAGDVRCDAVELRLGPPWPSASCAGCGCRRHCQPPRGDDELQIARTALLQFAVEHEHHTAVAPRHADRGTSR
jgi:hypothetical protein